MLQLAHEEADVLSQHSMFSDGGHAILHLATSAHHVRWRILQLGTENCQFAFKQHRLHLDFLKVLAGSAQSDQAR